MNNILICTDCSENAQKATEHCFSLFQQEPKKYFLLSTFSIPTKVIHHIIETVDTLKIEANKSLNNEFRRIKNLQLANYSSFERQAIFGKTENVVNRFINRNTIDLLVLGNQGKNYNADKLLGSTAEKILFEVPHPKLIVPNLNPKKNTNTKLVIAQEKQLQNRTWWSTVSELAKNKNYSIQLAVIPQHEKRFTKKENTLPSYIYNDVTNVYSFRGKTTSEIKEALNQMIQIEQPRLLNINLSDKKLAQQLIYPNRSKDSICDHIPFIIEPFEKQIHPIS